MSVRSSVHDRNGCGLTVINFRAICKNCHMFIDGWTVAVSIITCTLISIQTIVSDNVTL